MSSLGALQEALRKDPRNVKLWMRLGEELHARGRLEQALTCYERALELAPGHPDATYNRGVALHAQGRLAEALRSYETVLAAHPGHRAANDNRLAALVVLERHAEAIEGLERRLATEPHADSLVNLGLARQGLGDLPRARAAYAEALAASPGHRLAGWNLALLEMRLGDWEAGLARYEAYWPGNSRVNPLREFHRPAWAVDEPLHGRSILLHADEGLGDTIQHLRFVPVVARLAARVVLEVPRAMVDLARGIGAAIEVVERGAELPPTDRHAPLHGLALRLAMQRETVGAFVPYLRAPDDRIAHWRAQLGTGPERRIGIAWRGGTAYAEDHRRSMSLERLRPLFDIAGARLVSLQLDPPAADVATLAVPGAPERLGESARGLVETAALAMALDLVLSVDTAIAHLAGALGLPTWVLLPERADGRWEEERSTSAWYPSATLHRAARGETWDDVVARVRSELQRFVTLRP